MIFRQMRQTGISLRMLGSNKEYLLPSLLLMYNYCCNISPISRFIVIVMKFVSSCAINGRLVMVYAVKMSLFPIWYYCCIKFCGWALDF